MILRPTHATLRVICLSLLTFGILPDCEAEELRTWRDASGAFTLQAALVGVQGDLVVLRKADGTRVRVPLERLSTADRELLSQRRSVAASVPAPGASGRSELREWLVTDADETQTLEAELVDGRSGLLTLRKLDGTEVTVAVKSLDEAGQRHAYRQLGTALVDFAGVWRSESGTYYAITNGDDDKVHARLLKSNHIESIEGVLKRTGKILTSEQWLVEIKNDPTRKVHSASAQFAVNSTGDVTAKFDFFATDSRGVVRKRIKGAVTNSFVRLEGDQIPDDVLRRFSTRSPAGPRNLYEESLSTMVQVVGLDWYAKQRKVSVNDLRSGRGPRSAPTLSEALVNAASIGVRNQMIEGVVARLFPVYTRRERQIAEAVIEQYLKSRAELEGLERGPLQKWVTQQIDRRRGADRGVTEMTHFVTFLADVQERVRKSWTTALP